MRATTAGLLFRGALLLGLVGGLVGCDWGPEPAPRQSLVVEAFLETGQRPPTVRLRRVQPLGRPSGPPGDGATGASVRLTVGGNSIPYAGRPGRPGQYQPAVPADTVPATAPWTLRVQWNGTTVRAAGTTPRPLRMRRLCVDVPDAPVRAVRVDSLRRDSLDIPAERGFVYLVDATIEWRRPQGGPDTTRWVRAQLRPDTSQFASRLVDRFLQPATVRRADRFAAAGIDTRRWTGVYAVPVDTSTSPLPRHRLVASVVRGDSAFGDFARSRTDPALREPISNVEGALGVATAVAVDSVARVVDAVADGCYTPGSGRRESRRGARRTTLRPIN